MKFDQYQNSCETTAIYPDHGKGNPIYPILELAGETGEVAEKLLHLVAKENQDDVLCIALRLILRVGRIAEGLKKAMRDDDMIITNDRRDAILGSVFQLSRHSSVIAKDVLAGSMPFELAPTWENMNLRFSDGIGEELGDCLYPIASLASELNLDLQKIATNNVADLADRMERCVIMGDGDNR
jgi:NTP pyrophosphatase (non-canonical NTP hydrolase)